MDTTQAPIPIRTFSQDARPPGIAGARRRALRWWRRPKIMMFYPEELLLPWAAKWNRAPANGPRTEAELLRDDAGTWTGARVGDGAVERRAILGVRDSVSVRYAP